MCDDNLSIGYFQLIAWLVQGAALGGWFEEAVLNKSNYGEYHSNQMVSNSILQTQAYLLLVASNSTNYMKGLVQKTSDLLLA